MQIDVLSIGDALIDIFLSVNTADEHCHPNHEKSEICFTVGAKIPVDDCLFLLGGNASNVSVGLSRLQIKTALAAEIGNDEFSHKIMSELRKEQVDISLVKQTQNEQTSFSIDLTFMSDRTIFSRHVKREHHILFESVHPSFIYLTSLGEEWKPLYKRVNEYAQINGIKLAFNPGSKQLQAGSASFMDVIKNAEILFINKEEAEDLVYGGDQDILDELKKPQNLLQQVKNLGPKIVSMTDGKNGSYAIDEQENILFQAIVPSTFLQKTGVGDAYASGFLAAILNRKTLQEAMLWGAVNSSSVVEHRGAQGGLLTKEALLERINAFNVTIRDAN